MAGVLLLPSAVLATSRLEAQQRSRTFPSDEHYRSFRPMQEGDYVTAGRDFAATSRLKSAEGIWIDSIPYHAMIGECMYQMGDLSGALQQYTTALQVYLQYPDWLLAHQDPGHAVAQCADSNRHPPTWGPPSRPVRVANIPTRMAIRMGNTDDQNLQVLRQGGIFATPYFALVDAKEIVRCTVVGDSSTSGDSRSGWRV